MSSTADNHAIEKALLFQALPNDSDAAALWYSGTLACPALASGWSFPLRHNVALNVFWGF